MASVYQTMLLQRVPVERVGPHLADVVEPVELAPVGVREVPVGEGDPEGEDQREDHHRDDEERRRQHEERPLAAFAVKEDLRPAEAGGPEEVGVERGAPGREAEVDAARLVEELEHDDEPEERGGAPDERPAQQAPPLRDVVGGDDVEVVGFAGHRSRAVSGVP
jgi:hypothetical protein